MLFLGFLNDPILIHDFTSEQIFDISEKFNIQPEFINTPEVLPQNIVINADIKYPLQMPKTYRTNDEKRTALPSAYYNILFLKNLRNPHYCFDLTVSRK